MFSSIQTAAGWEGWDSQTSHWIVVLGDQPHLRDATLQELLRRASIDNNSVSQPSWQGRGAHPIIIPRMLWEQIPPSRESSLKDFLTARACRTVRIALDDAGLGLDLDTPEDYHTALAKFPPDKQVAADSSPASVSTNKNDDR